MSLFGGSKSYLGVDLGAGGVKVVELRAEKKRPVLFTYGFTVGSHDVHHLMEKHEPAIDEATKQNELLQPPHVPKADTNLVVDQNKITEYADMIKSVCKQARVQATNVAVSLPVSSVFHAIVTLPIVKKDEFDRILRAEIKKLLPYPIEEMVLDSQVLPSEPGSKAQRVLVNAVPRAIVVFYTRIFQKAGFKVTADSFAFEPESIALARSLVGRDTEVSVIVDMGAERTNFFIVDQGVPVTHHSIERGGDKMNGILQTILGFDGTELTEQLKRDMFSHLLNHSSDNLITRAQFLELFNLIVDPILKEIDYSLGLYLRQSNNQNKKPEKVILTGGSSLFPFLADAIGDQFKLKCYMGDPWGRVVYQESLKPILNAIGPRMSVAIGLALRNVV